ncbi:winged helix-turn-helix transcriptional regulator [Nonomuraea sp. NPDC050022]|uniref:winged helix-turn-helix transcriptional regulator n=1 Tax=unclassified Nonomuraea TaxID=2593643 RepID=UPI00340B6893
MRVRVRTVTPSTPPQVSYTLTDLGQGITEPLQVLSDWIRDHANAILAAQAAHEGQGG